MKQKYTIFYSWQNDTDGDRQYVRNVLQNSVDAIKKELDIDIQIDSDSRDEDGEKSIDVAILKKIANCDFFVCDVTPVGKLHPSAEIYKELPNPNVMLELGFAIGNIGWERCILVWNTKIGAQQIAPFDILKESVDRFCTNMGFYKEDFDMWDYLQSGYRNSIEFQFVDEELTASMNDLITNIANMEMFAAKYFDQNEVQPDYRKVRNFYNIMDSSEAAKEEVKCIKLADEHCTNVIDSLKRYRMLIAKKFGE